MLKRISPSWCQRWIGVPVLAGLLASCVSSGGNGQSAATDVVVVRGATSAEMDPGPLWVSRATWDPDEERVVFADPGSGSIYVYDVKGRIRRDIADRDDGPLEFPRPNYSVLIGKRYLIATSSHGWIWFDDKLEAKAIWELDWEAGGGKVSRMETSEFDFSETQLYAIGETMSFDGEWSGKGVFAVSLKDRTVQQMASIGEDREEISFYNEPPFNLSVCGGKAWLLQMASTVSIVEARDGGKRLRSFPAEFRRRPSIPPLVSASSVRSRKAALRNTAVAEGLFCADRVLLLLAYTPRAEGGFRWLVYPIDPSHDVMATPIELPTTADEIVFVPGRKRWAVLEKGAMQHVGTQPLTRIISFPRPSLRPHSR